MVTLKPNIWCAKPHRFYSIRRSLYFMCPSQRGKATGPNILRDNHSYLESRKQLICDPCLLLGSLTLSRSRPCPPYTLVCDDNRLKYTNHLHMSRSIARANIMELVKILLRHIPFGETENVEGKRHRIMGVFVIGSTELLVGRLLGAVQRATFTNWISSHSSGGSDANPPRERYYRSTRKMCHTFALRIDADFYEFNSCIMQ